MGVGKTTTSRELQKIMPKAVFLDGDWCWDMNPFVVNTETKEMVTDNIRHMLNNFIHCTAFENIIFCWVMHRQEIIDDIVARLDLKECTPFFFSLVCSTEELKNRIYKDIKKGIRTEDVLERALPRLKLYQELNTIKIDVSEITAYEAASRIQKTVGE